MTNEIKKNAAAEMTADEMNQEYAITWTNEITKNENMNDAAKIKKDAEWARCTKLENVSIRATTLATLTRLVHAGIIYEMMETEPDAIELENALDELDRLNKTLIDDIDAVEQEYIQAARENQ